MTSSADRPLDYLSSGLRPWILLTLFSLALFLPGIASLPPVDRDEPRYTQASRQMLETGDYLRIRFQDEARNKKPAGVYWLQAGAVSLLSSSGSSTLWPYRLVSVCGATLAVLLTFFFGSRIFDRPTGLVGAALLAASVDLVVEAHVATTDAAQLAASVAAQGVLGLAYLGSRRGEPINRLTALGFWIAQGGALLIKGPVVPGLSLLTVLALGLSERRWRWLRDLRPGVGVAVTLAMVLPWLILVELATSGAFLQESVGHDLGGKLAGAQESHGAPPLYYALLLPVTFWPGSLLLGVTALWAWRTRRLPASRLMMAWLIPFWILLELVPTKLPHYILPLYPALALASARAATVARDGGYRPPPPWLAWGVGGVWAAVALGLGIGLAALALWADEATPAVVAGAASAAAAVVLVYNLIERLRRSADVTLPGLALVAALALEVPALALILPAANRLWPSRQVAALVAAHRHPGERVAATGYTEPSLVFLLGTDTVLLQPEQAAESLQGRAVALSIVEDHDDAAFRAAFGRAPNLVGEVEGYDYSNGRSVLLRVYALAQ